jgi:hypothetical protein
MELQSHPSKFPVLYSHRVIDTRTAINQGFNQLTPSTGMFSVSVVTTSDEFNIGELPSLHSTFSLCIQMKQTNANKQTLFDESRSDVP